MYHRGTAEAHRDTNQTREHHGDGPVPSGDQNTAPPLTLISRDSRKMVPVTSQIPMHIENVLWGKMQSGQMAIRCGRTCRSAPIEPSGLLKFQFIFGHPRRPNNSSRSLWNRTFSDEDCDATFVPSSLSENRQA